MLIAGMGHDNGRSAGVTSWTFPVSGCIRAGAVGFGKGTSPLGNRPADYSGCAAEDGSCRAKTSFQTSRTRAVQPPAAVRGMKGGAPASER